MPPAAVAWLSPWALGSLKEAKMASPSGNAGACVEGTKSASLGKIETSCYGRAAGHENTRI